MGAQSQSHSRRNSARNSTHEVKEPRRRSGKERERIGSISNLGPREMQDGLAPPKSRRGSEYSQASHSKQLLPEVPRALRSLVPGASLHPALVQMTLRSQGEKANRFSALHSATGSQF